MKTTKWKTLKYWKGNFLPCFSWACLHFVSPMHTSWKILKIMLRIRQRIESLENFQSWTWLPTSTLPWNLTTLWSRSVFPPWNCRGIPGVISWLDQIHGSQKRGFQGQNNLENKEIGILKTIMVILNLILMANLDKRHSFNSCACWEPLLLNKNLKKTAAFLVGRQNRVILASSIVFYESPTNKRWGPLFMPTTFVTFQ